VTIRQALCLHRDCPEFRRDPGGPLPYPTSTVGKPSTMVPPCAVMSPMRACGIFMVNTVNDPSTTPNPPLPVTLDLCVEDGVDRSVGQILTHLLGLLVHREVIGAHLDPSSYFLKASLSSRHMASSPVSGLSGCNTRVIARYTDLARSHPTVANSVLAQYAVAVRLF